jgi:hypothetical protein
VVVLHVLVRLELEVAKRLLEESTNRRDGISALPRGTTGIISPMRRRLVPLLLALPFLLAGGIAWWPAVREPIAPEECHRLRVGMTEREAARVMVIGSFGSTSEDGIKSILAWNLPESGFVYADFDGGCLTGTRFVPHPRESISNRLRRWLGLSIHVPAPSGPAPAMPPELPP